jgi:hypothetical protein
MSDPDPDRLRADAEHDRRRIDQLDPDGTHPLGIIARHWIDVATRDHATQQGT